MDDTTLAALRTAAGALSDVGFAAMLGALATPALLRDGSSAWATRRLRRSRTLFGAATLLALVASLAWMAFEAVAMTDAPLPAALLASRRHRRRHRLRPRVGRSPRLRSSPALAAGQRLPLPRVRRCASCARAC